MSLKTQVNGSYSNANCLYRPSGCLWGFCVVCLFGFGVFFLNSGVAAKGRCGESKSIIKIVQGMIKM